MTGREIFKILTGAGAAPKKIDKFLGWLTVNIDIYRAFEKKTFEVMTHESKQLSAKEIWERLRRDDSVMPNQRGEFKLQNNYTAYFAHIFCAKWPIYSNTFQTKRLK